MKAEKSIRKISLRRKILQYLLLITFVSLILVGSFWIASEVNNFKNEVQVLKETYSENKKTEIKNKILEVKEWIYWIRNHPPESVTRMIPEYAIESVKSSGHFEKLLQKYCLDTLSRIRYAKDEYIFINSLNGKALASNGNINEPPIDIFITGDTSWISIFKVEQLAESHQGGLFYTYSFQKISEPKTSLKTSFFNYLPEWEWIIGTGFYEDDVNEVIEQKKEVLFADLRRNILNVALVLLISILLSFFIVLFFSRRLSKNIRIFRNFFSKAVREHIYIDKSQLNYKEFDILAERANLMVEENIKAEEELKLHRDNLEELVIQRTAELEKEKVHAQSADRLKSAFLATMSHELRTPLNSILGFTGILMKERPGALNDEQKKQLGMVQNSARHLLSLINDVLDISKIEAGQMKLNFQSINIAEVIDRVVESNRPMADKKNLRLIVSIDPDVNEIVSDKLRIHQTILNLLNNAVKFTEVGTITINCFLISNFVKIQVIDTGIGIEKEHLDRLFKPFMQIDTGITRRHEGTGLGLSICKKLIMMLGGEIEVEFEYGCGSTFTVTLPLVKANGHEA